MHKHPCQIFTCTDRSNPSTKGKAGVEEGEVAGAKHREPILAVMYSCSLCDLGQDSWIKFNSWGWIQWLILIRKQKALSPSATKFDPKLVIYG